MAEMPAPEISDDALLYGHDPAERIVALHPVGPGSMRLYRRRSPTEDEKAANALFSRLAGGGEAISADKVSALLEEEYGLDPGSFDVLYRGQSDELSQESFASLLGH